MEQEYLAELASSAIKSNLEMAEKQLGIELPRKSQLGILWGDYPGELYTLEDAIPVLWEEGYFPMVVDVAFRGIVNEQSLIIWIPSGHPKVLTVEETPDPRFGPFKPVGVMIPSKFGGRPPLSQGQLLELGDDWVEGRWPIKSP